MFFLKLLIPSITTTLCTKLCSTPLRPEGPKSQLWQQQKQQRVCLVLRFHRRGVSKHRIRVPMLHGDQYVVCSPCSVGMHIAVFQHLCSENNRLFTSLTISNGIGWFSLIPIQWLSGRPKMLRARSHHAIKHMGNPQRGRNWRIGASDASKFLEHAHWYLMLFCRFSSNGILGVQNAAPAPAQSLYCCWNPRGKPELGVKLSSVGVM